MNDGVELAPWADAIEAEAAAWFARVRSGTMSSAETMELERWLAIAAHEAAFVEVESMWHAVAALHDDPKLLQLREDARADGQTKRLWAFGAIAASILAAICLAVFFTPFGFRAGETSPDEVRFATVTGQRLPIALADGSTIQLDANSSVRVRLDADRRAIEIEHGRAFFRVRHDPHRPFIVSAGGRSVTAVGTAFAVDTFARPLDVVLVEGRVRVEGRSQEGRRAIEMTAGSRLEVTPDGGWHAGQVDPAKATAWLNGRLVFDNARLADVVAELGRYTDRSITLSRDGTGERRLSAVLLAGDVDTFVQAVRTLNLAEVQTDKNDAIVLRQK